MPDKKSDVVYNVKVRDDNWEREEQWSQEQFDELGGALYDNYPKAEVYRTGINIPMLRCTPSRT